MKARWILTAAVLIAAACNDDGGGLFVPFTDSGNVTAPSARTRAVVVRGVISGSGGQAVSSASVRIIAVPVDANGACQGTPTQVDVLTGSNGGYRAQLRVSEQVITMCVTVTATPPAGSSLRGATLDLGRISPVLEGPGVTPPERLANLTLTL